VRFRNVAEVFSKKETTDDHDTAGYDKVDQHCAKKRRGLTFRLQHRVCDGLTDES